MGKSHQKSILAALVALLFVAIIGLVMTRGGGTAAVVIKDNHTAAKQAPTVDQRPLQTARSLANLAVTPQDRQLAQEAARLADHEVDLAFDSALREAAQHPTPVSPEVRQLDARVNSLTARVAAEQERVTRQGQLAAKAPEDQKAKLEQDQQLAEAQLELDKDELDDAKNDLMRGGGDAVGRIERMRDEHEAAVHPSANNSALLAGTGAGNGSSAGTPGNGGSLVTEVQNWAAIRDELKQVRQAQQEAIAAAAALSRAHDALEQETSQERSQGSVPATPTAAVSATAAQGGTSSGPSQTAGNRAGTKASVSNSAAVVTLHHLAGDQKILAEFDQRVQDEQELADIYGSWIVVLQGRQRAAAHAAIQSLVWILLIAVAVLIIDQLVDRFFTGLAPDRKRLLNLRVVLRFAVQAFGLLAILFVVLGKPAQMPTILGLAGAGLTVALKDFIVAFFGWFVLMGRNGIRVGDWVEIEGVGGEVVEVGLLRTVLLETGNWTDAGHPTGRKVAFVNSFAIEGHFFNFSTSGQWLWDELQLLIPAGRDPYPLIQEIRDIVTRETEASSRQAEQEWQRVSHRYGMKSFSAEPAIDVQPTSSGVQIVVRYITRAHERHEVRARLNHALVELLHGKRAEATTR